MGKIRPIRLSKSQYLKGRQCIKKVWLYNHKKDVSTAPSAFQSHLFFQGDEVGILAQKLFPNGEDIFETHKEPEKALKHTQEAIEQGAKVLYEAAFMFDDVLIRADIIKKNTDDTWDLLEVKSSSSWKKIHCLDLAVQKYIMQNCGLKIKKASIVHLNKEYVRGEELVLQDLFQISPLDDEIANEYELVPSYLDNIKKFLKLEQEPTADIGSVCKSPYPCEFKDYCWGDITQNSIHYISRINDKKRFELIEMGCEEITDVPDNYKLSDSQKIQVQCAKDESELIESSEIRKFIDDIEFPLYHLDFETLPLAVPQFKGYSPYQHLTFQYSLHIQTESSVDHHEYLLDTLRPPLDLLENLINKLGNVGSIVVYNASFERSRLLEMKNLFPQYSNEMSYRQIWCSEEF